MNGVPQVGGMYRLVGKLPVLCSSIEEWAKWYEKGDRRIGLDVIGPLTISTVFLGVDHGFGFNDGNPILFETMIFDGGDDNYQERCETWDEAEAMHKRAVEIAIMMVDMAEVSLKVFAKLFETGKTDAKENDT